MTVRRGFLIVVISGIVFAAVGGGIGYFLGVSAPDYYRTVYHIRPGESLHAPQLGLGLGLTQGLVGGLVLGLIIVVTVAWYNARVFGRTVSEDGDYPPITSSPARASDPSSFSTSRRRHSQDEDS